MWGAQWLRMLKVWQKLFSLFERFSVCMISIIFGEIPYQSTGHFSAVLRSRDETKYVSETVKAVLAENVTILSLIY